MEASHPELANALAHDAAGRYDEAINALARGTRAGSLECMMTLGERLLAGDRAPALPAEGLGFLAEAAEKGRPQAARRAAALLALGLRAPADWAQGRDWLQRAAEKGDEPARAQLLALCADRALAQRASAGGVPWSAVAGAIDLGAWRRSPEPRLLSAEPRVAIFPGFLSPECCALLVRWATGRLERALVYDPERRSDIADVHRNNQAARFGLENVEYLHVLLQGRMAAATGQPVTHFEAPTVLRYAPGERIANHYDFVNPETTRDYAGEIARNGQRLLTFIVYLNDAYAGGETTFSRLQLRHRGTPGEGICFVNALPDLQPDLRMIHAGEEVTDGEKWIVTQFIRSRPMRAGGRAHPEAQ